MAFALKQAEVGTPVEEVCKMGISDATFYNRRGKYGDLGPSELRRLKRQRWTMPGAKSTCGVGLITKCA